MASEVKTEIQVVQYSGFPFQLRIAKEIRDNKKLLWSVVCEEFAYEIENNSGFIDLVLTCSSQMSSTANDFLILECKKLFNTKWIFFDQTTNDVYSSYSRSLCAVQLANGQVVPSWTNCTGVVQQIKASSYREEWKPRGRDGGLLEQLASEVCIATEAFATRTLSICDDYYRNLTFAPVIVTTAKLIMCNFALDNVDIEDGNIQEKDMDLTEELPYIRFQKSLGTTLKRRKMNNIQNDHEENHRTVYIVNSMHLVEFLKKYQYVQPAVGWNDLKLFTG